MRSICNASWCTAVQHARVTSSFQRWKHLCVSRDLASCPNTTQISLMVTNAGNNGQSNCEHPPCTVHRSGVTHGWALAKLKAKAAGGVWILPHLISLCRKRQLFRRLAELPRQQVTSPYSCMILIISHMAAKGQEEKHSVLSHYAHKNAVFHTLSSLDNKLIFISHVE